MAPVALVEQYPHLADLLSVFACSEHKFPTENEHLGSWCNEVRHLPFWKQLHSELVTILGSSQPAGIATLPPPQGHSVDSWHHWLHKLSNVAKNKVMILQKRQELEASSLIEAHIHNATNWELFECLIQKISKEYRGVIRDYHTDSLQRYYVMSLDEDKFCLYASSYTGVHFYSLEGGRCNKVSNLVQMLTQYYSINYFFNNLKGLPSG